MSLKHNSCTNTRTVKLKQDIHDRRLTHTELCSQPGYTHAHSQSWDTHAQGRVRTIGRI